MRTRGKYCVLGMLVILIVSLSAFQVDKKAFYKALSAQSQAEIDTQLSVLEQEKSSPTHDAYRGALLMKKAGFQKGVKQKVKMFKEGAHLLEGEIGQNPANVEFRFLRLTVQEHAPGILNYNKKLDEDKLAIIDGYDKLDASLKSIIANYAQDSKVLHGSDLKGK